MTLLFIVYALRETKYVLSDGIQRMPVFVLKNKRYENVVIIEMVVILRIFMIFNKDLEIFL